VTRDKSNIRAKIQQVELLLRTGQTDGAIRALDRILEQAPREAEVWNMRGVVCGQTGRSDQALASFEKALALDPASISALSNKGNLLRLMGRLPEALQCLDKAVSADPDQYSSWAHRADIAGRLGDHRKAAESFGAMALLNPTDTELWLRRSDELLARGRIKLAAGTLDVALALDPENPVARYNRLYCKTRLSDWTGFGEDLTWLGGNIDCANSPRSQGPFMLFGVCDDPAFQRKVAEATASAYSTKSPTFAAPSNEGKIRIGYFSSDFHEHATAWLVAELFELHDRSRFEVYGYSFGPQDRSPMRCRLEESFDLFFDVQAMPAAEIAAKARTDGIDIAIDLKGYTTEARPTIFAERAARVQVNYLGWPGTMGADFMDYIIADETVIPSGLRQHYSEAIAWLSGSYQVNDRKRPVAERVFTRAEMGLPKDAFVFCSFNNNYKIMPSVFACWMRILRAVEGSVLWLFAGNQESAQNLRREASSRGVSPERIVVANLMRNEEHLARHRLADLFLDTLPCNAHTTMSDALWGGLPAITRTGSTFAGRVGASLVRAVGLEELVVETEAEYEELAIALARDPERLGAIRSKLAAAKSTAPLFDTPAFVRNIERAYEVMHGRAVEGLSPGDFRVEM